MFSKVVLQCQMVSWPTGQNLKEKNCYWIGFQKLSVASDPRIDYVCLTLSKLLARHIVHWSVDSWWKTSSKVTALRSLLRASLRGTHWERGERTQLCSAGSTHVVNTKCDWIHRAWLLLVRLCCRLCIASLETMKSYSQIQHLPEVCQPLAVWNVHFLCSKLTVYLIFTSSLLEICAAGQTSLLCHLCPVNVSLWELE